MMAYFVFSIFSAVGIVFLEQKGGRQNCFVLLKPSLYEVPAKREQPCPEKAPL